MGIWVGAVRWGGYLGTGVGADTWVQQGLGRTRGYGLGGHLYGLGGHVGIWVGADTWVRPYWFSNFNTPRGQTCEHTPHPTHDARTISCWRWAYHRTSMPISQ